MAYTLGAETVSSQFATPPTPFTGDWLPQSVRDALTPPAPAMAVTSGTTAVVAPRQPPWLLIGLVGAVGFYFFRPRGRRRR